MPEIDKDTASSLSTVIRRIVQNIKEYDDNNGDLDSFRSARETNGTDRIENLIDKLERKIALIHQLYGADIDKNKSVLNKNTWKDLVAKFSDRSFSVFKKYIEMHFGEVYKKNSFVYR